MMAKGTLRDGRAWIGVAVAGAAFGLAGCGGEWRKAGAPPSDTAEVTASCLREMPVKVYGRESRVRVYWTRDVDPTCMQEKGYTRR